MKKENERHFEINDAVDVYHLMKPRRMYVCTAQIKQFSICNLRQVVRLVGVAGLWDLEQIEHTKQKDDKE